MTALLDADIDREMPESMVPERIRNQGTSLHKEVNLLKIAVSQSSLEMVRALVKHGFNVNPPRRRRAYLTTNRRGYAWQN